MNVFQKNADNFSQLLLTWFDKHGRKDLPWANPATPYTVWISEIMLQQTQVNTVIPYFQRFMQRFPAITALAAAPLDAVLHQWAGLGYYARARHLHQTAQQVCTHHAGQLPETLAELMNLPGIGRSTAGAILALAYGKRYPILDGNVKRILCRYHAINGWPGETAVAKKLWQQAEQHLPAERLAAYTQALMDLGATLCTRHAPQCAHCPLQSACAAHQAGQATAYPTAKSRRALPIKTTVCIMLQNQQGAVLLEKRPEHGIWGGLWSFPECTTVAAVSSWYQQRFGSVLIPQQQVWTPIRHTFTHFHLDLTPVHLTIPVGAHPTMVLSHILWYNIAHPQACGLAAPIARLLTQLALPKTGE